MTQEELIKYVTEEVFKRISNSSLVSGSQHQPEKKALVMTAKSGAIREGLKETLESCFICTFQNRQEAYEKELSAESFDCILLTELTNGQLASAGLGIPFGAEARPMLEAFFCERKVIIIEEGICFIRDKCISKSLYELYSSYLDKIISFGADIVKNEDLEDRIKEYCLTLSSTSDSKINEFFIRDKVITERSLIEILKAVPNAQIISICQDSVVTPLAFDVITKNNIEIKRSIERCKKE